MICRRIIYNIKATHPEYIHDDGQFRYVEYDGSWMITKYKYKRRLYEEYSSGKFRYYPI